MIPITVRILSGQGDSAFKSSVYYASGILITYTALGTFAALSGSMFGSVSQSIAFNTTFAVIMAVLGLSMLGFGNFAKLQNLGNKIGNGKKSPFNTFMMGTGAGLVAAPCTGPILGALLAYSTKNGNLFESCLLMFTYSFGFSLPYVFLGGTAAKISNIKVSPKVQIGTKILFASVMFSLSLYYLRIPLYEQLIQLKPYWTTTAQVMTSIGLVLSLIWLTVERLQHSKYLMIIPCAVLAVGVFSISQWATSSEHSSELAHYLTQEEGYAAAAKQNKPMLIDLWAEWCEACKKMDATTFMDPRVIKELSDNWILLKLDLTQDNDINDAIQEKYEIPGLPTLVLLPQQGKLGEKKLLIGYQTVDKLLEKLENYKKKIISL
jgi:thiol:disulfide interchange protein DsbD